MNTENTSAILDSLESLCDDAAALGSDAQFRALYAMLESARRYVDSRQCAMGARLEGYTDDAHKGENRADQRMGDLRGAYTADTSKARALRRMIVATGGVS